MRLRKILPLVLACALAVVAPLGAAEDQTLPYKYLKIYLKINGAFQLEKQGNYPQALADFKDCYTRLQQIHNADPDWESALVMGRMNDCRTKILELSNVGAGPAVTPTASAVSGGGSSSSEVTDLKQKLVQVQQELSDVKAKYENSQAEVTTLRGQLATVKDQLSTVNDQLTALKSQQSEDNQVGRLLSQNKDLNDKLAETQKELASIKTSPKSALALMRVQLKNTQDQLAASEASHTALQQTTTTLNQQLDDAQNDLRAANQRLAAAPPNAPEYATLKRENEVMRDILTREIQEQAHRDMAKRLAQEEFDRLRITSKVLQEQLDILGSPMTPPSSDQERALLDGLRMAGAQVTPVPTESGANTFSASNAGPGASSNSVTTAITPAGNNTTNQGPSTSSNAASATPGPAGNNSTANPSVAANSATNTPAATPPLTNEALAQANASVPAVSPTPPTTVTPAGPPNGSGSAATNTGTTETPPATATNSLATAPPTSPSTAPSTPSNPAWASDTNSEPVPPTPTNIPTVTPPTAPPPASETAANSAKPPDTTPTNSVAATPPAASTNTAETVAQPPTTNAVPPTPETTDYAKKARLPEDMRDTATQAADLFKNQRYDDSAAKYQEIIDKYPESLYAWSNLGVVRFQQGKMPEALKALQRAVSLSPTDAFSYQNLGIVYYQMGQYENAISALERALALDPTNAKSHNYLGCACSQKGWSEVAEKEFLKAIEIDDSFGDAHFNLALVYATEKPPSLEMARRHYKRALELGISSDPRLEKLLQMDGVAQNPPAGG